MVIHGNIHSIASMTCASATNFPPASVMFYNGPVILFSTVSGLGFRF